MYQFNHKPSIGMEVRLLQMLKRKLDTRSILRPRIEENTVVTIYEDDRVCGGALLFGHDSTEYLLCFLGKEDYTAENISSLKLAIEEEFHGVKEYDICCAEKIPY